MATSAVAGPAAANSTSPPAHPVAPSKPYELATLACKALGAACSGFPVADAKHALGKYSSAAVPGISLERYAAHLAARMEHGEAGILLGLCLIMRVWRTHRAAPSPDTLHRLLLAATTVAMKAHFDDFYVNKYMARIGGLEAPRELAELEAHLFVTLLGGSATVRQKEIRATLDGGLVPLGRMLSSGGLDVSGTLRKVEVLLDEDVRPLEPFAAYYESQAAAAHAVAARQQQQQQQQQQMQQRHPPHPGRTASPQHLSLSHEQQMAHSFGSPHEAGESVTPQQLPSFHEQFGASPAAASPANGLQVPQNRSLVNGTASPSASVATTMQCNARPWPSARPDMSQSAVYAPQPCPHNICGIAPNGSIPSGLWSGSVTAPPMRMPHTGFTLANANESSSCIPAGSATSAIRAARGGGPVASTTSVAANPHA